MSFGPRSNMMLVMLVALAFAPRAALAQVRIQIPDTPPPAVTTPGAPSAGAANGAQLGMPFGDAWSTTPGTTFGGPPAGGVGSAFPRQTPPVLFPDRGQPATLFDGQAFPDLSRWAEPFQLFQRPRLQYAWLYGSGGPRDLDQSEIDVSAGVALPNFLYSQQPIYLYPSFSMQIWDGPEELPGMDLPGQVYGAYLDTLWASNPQYPFGAEVGVRVGVYTDFDTITTDSLRIQGTGLARINLTPTITVRGGVSYLDRVNIKLLPVGGILWQPSNQMRLDFYFPRPKFAMYLATLGNFDIWGYVGGEYGGGSWTVRRPVPVPFSDRVDVNDIRLLLGFEWGTEDEFKQGQRIGFIEAGWVLDREVIFANGDNFTLRDTVMVRAGIGY